MLVILQMYQVFEGQKRTTTTGGDAQENGLFALTMIERDAKMAGYGLSTSQTLACNTYFTYRDTGSGTPGPIPDFSTAPITIADGGTGPDTITLRSATTLVGGAPASIRENMPMPSAQFKVNTIFGFTPESLILVVQGGNCTLMEVETVQTSLHIGHGPDQSQLSTTNPNYNPPANCYTGSNACASFPAYTVGALVFNLSDISIKTYSINSASSLQLVDNSAPAIPIAAQIVELQAQYGIADVGSQAVNNWVDATGTDWAAPTPANIRRIKAVRIAVVARSTQQEKVVVTGTPLQLWPGKTMALSTDDQRYRYKIYQTIIPLRNVMWANI
jgi:type IV pilus assembly protein PilW